MDGNWALFLDKLRPLLRRTDNPIIAKLTRKFFSTSSHFQRDVQTGKLLNRYIDRIRESPSHVYIILLELKQKLKNSESLISEVLPQSETQRYSLRSSTPPVYISGTNVTPNDVAKRRVTLTTLTKQSPSEEDGLVGPPSSRKRKHVRVEESSSSSSGSIKVSNNSSHEAVILNCKTAPLQQEEVRDPSPPSHFKLRVLERRMELLSHKIRRLEAAEMDVGELGNEESAYLRLDSLKRQYLAAWRQLCRLRGISRHACSFSHLPFRYSGCRFAVINQAVERYINTSHIFPDCEAIHRVVESTSIDKGLDLSATAVETLAREIFTDVGARLKRRREREFKHDFGCHLIDAENIANDDPALHSPELRLRLLENKRIAECNIESVLTKYSQLQESLEGNKYGQTPAVDLDVSDVDEPTKQLVTSDSIEPVSKTAQLDETPLPITTVDASIRCPVFMDDYVDLENLNRRQAQVDEEDIEMEEEVPPIEHLENPPETITISDSEEETEANDEIQIVGCEYQPPRDSPSTQTPPNPSTTQTIMTGQRIALRLPNGGSMLISSSQQRVIQIIPPLGGTQ